MDDDEDVLHEILRVCCSYAEGAPPASHFLEPVIVDSLE
jgi:hypothetical protein